ncbi:helix-turn-helix domain-containing protein [Flindersiella endophytica]
MLVRKLSELRSEIANSADGRPAVTDSESAPAPGGRQSQTRLTPDDVARLVAGYRSGRTIYELAGEFKIARQTVSEHLHRHGVRMRRRGLTETDVAEAVRLRKQGLTLKTISDHFEVCIDTVRHHLRRRGVATDRPA